MSFTELNAVENFIIHALFGVNLNKKVPGEHGADTGEAREQYGTSWTYVPSGELNRGSQEVMVEDILKAALVRINPCIREQPERADEVVYKLRAVLLSVNQVGLVRANEQFSEWLNGKKPPLRRK